jgi:hypothetical protein
MVRTLEIVFKRIGKKAPRKIMKTGDFMPMPNHKIAMGIQARGGMGLTTSKRGRVILRKPGDHPIKSPKGMASKAAIA